MSCTNTTAMYLNVSTDICASASASRSGNTITVSGTFSVTQGNSWNYNAIYAYVDGQTSWTKVKPYKTDGGGSWSAGFSFSFDDANAGTRSYNAIFQVWNNAESGTVGNPASVGFSVSYDAANSAPTGLSCSNITRGQESFTANVSISGWGVGSGTRYRELQCWTYNSSSLVEPRRWQPQYGDSLSGNITVNNSSNTSSTPLTITPNTMYTLGVYATNGAVATGSVRVGDYTTLPPTPTISNIATTTSTADFTYSVPNQGGKYNMTLKYQLNGGSNVTVTTLSGSGTKAGTFTISNLSPGTTYTVTAALSTSAGEVVSNTVTFTTATPNPKIYGPEKRLASIGSYTLETTTGFDPAVVSVDLTSFKNFLNSQTNYLKTINSDATFSKILIYVAYLDGTYRFRITLNTGGTGTSLQGFVDENHSTLVSTVQSATGISLSPTFGNIVQTSFIVPADEVYEYKTKEITKLYGPVVTTIITGVSGTIRSESVGIGAGIQFDGAVFWNKVENVVDTSKTMDYLQQRVGHGGDSYYLTLFYTDGTSYAFENGGDVNENLYGITYTGTPDYSGFDYIDLTMTTTTGTVTKEIKKLYGSVNGVTKLIFQSQSST